MYVVLSVMMFEYFFDVIKDDKIVMKFLGFFFCFKSLIKSNGLISFVNYS